LFFWGFGLFIAHIIFLALRIIGASAAIAAAVFFLAIFWGIRYATSTAEVTSWTHLIPHFSVGREAEEISKV
jgi:hypothetical protein